MYHWQGLWNSVTIEASVVSCSAERPDIEGTCVESGQYENIGYVATHNAECPLAFAWRYSPPHPHLTPARLRVTRAVRYEYISHLV